MTVIPTVDFNGKVAFVSGAGSGIGRATAMAFAQAGAAVTAVDINEGGLTGTATELERFGGRVLPRTCAAPKVRDVKAALDATVATYGRLDAAFNNAGIEQAGAMIADISEEVWERVVAV